MKCNPFKDLEPLLIIERHETPTMIWFQCQIISSLGGFTVIALLHLFHMDTTSISVYWPYYLFVSSFTCRSGCLWLRTIFSPKIILSPVRSSACPSGVTCQALTSWSTSTGRRRTEVFITRTRCCCNPSRWNGGLTGVQNGKNSKNYQILSLLPVLDSTLSHNYKLYNLTVKSVYKEKDI